MRAKVYVLERVPSYQVASYPPMLQGLTVSDARIARIGLTSWGLSRLRTVRSCYIHPYFLDDQQALPSGFVLSSPAFWYFWRRQKLYCVGQ